MNELYGAQIHITGIVQGVGFRPFVYTLARRLSLTGWVRNTSAGVDIRVDGTKQVLEAFTLALKNEAPPLARIDQIQVSYGQSDGFAEFEILDSQAIPGAFLPISPDVSVCSDCLHELFDPENRRYLYPFINCTNCGPRFSIIEDIPYDRPKTTMASFTMCPECAAEYHDPVDRRFHAQPIACPVCGPNVWLEIVGQQKNQEGILFKKEAAILETRNLLNQGRIVAIKGLGGFHLACDATNHRAVAELRRRKLRVDKPFALMMPDLAAIEANCFVDKDERELLESHQRPIVILTRRPESFISKEVAPGQDTLGVMLPYTPLHFLLFTGELYLHATPALYYALVMTSGNLSEEPIATDNAEARERLSSLADAFLMHDRPIRSRCDDSVMRVFHSPMKQRLPSFSIKTGYPLRRSRGYAPFPVRLPCQSPPLLAVGAELKNTFCITREDYAFLSHHIGDLENYETLRSFEDGIQHFERLFRVHPQILAYDLHPDYLASRYAVERAERENLPAFGIQHHHAHIAACMAENALSGDRPVIGISFDGTGYGEDGAIWGGEFLIADYDTYSRPYHLVYVPLPGGDLAVREPWRMSLAWLDHAGIDWMESLPPLKYLSESRENPGRLLEALKYQLQTGLNAPLTSSMGRLFDAVSALVGVKQMANYEAQAAIELEALAALDEAGHYLDQISGEENIEQGDQNISHGIDLSAIFYSIICDLQKKVSIPIISARFHNTIAQMVLKICQQLRENNDIDQVVLSGGVWQNVTLLKKTYQLLAQHDFDIYLHRLVPTNDGGLALGQAAIAARRWNKGM
jgi:hydrogenase maturation protein HypF